jgi:PadR family transcriptional regulator PadR
MSENALRLNQGTIHTPLVRFPQEGGMAAAWGVSENGRKAKFHPTRSGRRRLLQERRDGERMAGVPGRVLRLAGRS